MNSLMMMMGDGGSSGKNSGGNGSKNRASSHILMISVVFVPIIMNSLFADPFTCPATNAHVTNLLMLFSPAASFLLMDGVFILQKYRRKRNYRRPFESFLKVIPRLMTSILILGIVQGAVFLRGDYFACLMVGSQPVPGPNQTELAVKLFEYNFKMHKTASKVIGWLLVMVTLGIVSTTLMWQTATKREKQDGKIWKIRYMKMLKSQKKGIMKAELKLMATTSSIQSLETILRKYGMESKYSGGWSSNSISNKHAFNFIKDFHMHEKESIHQEMNAEDRIESSSDEEENEDDV